MRSTLPHAARAVPASLLLLALAQLVLAAPPRREPRFENLEPVPLRELPPVRPSQQDRHRLVIRDQHGQSITREGARPRPANTETRANTPSGEGNWERLLELYAEQLTPTEAGDGTEFDKNFAGWSIVAAPAAADYPRRVRLWIDWPVGDDGGCSGTLIDPLHVLTAGHCVFSEDLSMWANSITVAPGYSNGMAPFGTANSVAFLSWEDWTQDLDFDDDLAVIQLDRPIGAITGWWGYGYDESCSFFESGSWRHAGWPGEAAFGFDGEVLYENSGDFDDCGPVGYSNVHGFDMPSWGGQSGSGAERDGAIYAVLSTGNRVDHTSDCSLDQAKYEDVENWIAEHTPSSFDLLPLSANVTPTVVAGSSIGDFEFLLHNYSSQWIQGSWPYKIYLSTDDQIGPGDVPLRTGSFQAAIGAKSAFWWTISSAGIIPPSTTAGNYFIGIVLDISDANSTNNDSSGQEAAPITVNCPSTPAAAQLLSPTDGATCRPSDGTTLSWVSQGAGVTYEVELFRSPVHFSYLTTTDNYLPLNGLLLGSEYGWRVRTRSSCGVWGPWSSQRNFHTVPTPYVYAQLVAPADEEACQNPASTLLDWSDIPGAISYELQISANWCYEGPITTGIVGSQRVVSGLAPGTTYYWRVRAQLGCGVTSDWSSSPGFCWRFRTTAQSIAAPTPKTPYNGDPCVRPDPLLNWDHIPGWGSYEAQLGTSCGSGTIYSTSSNGVQVQGLQQSVSYHWRLRAIDQCGIASGWSNCAHFSVDAIPPFNPPAIIPWSHQPATWSNDNTIDVAWDLGGDLCSGIPYYGALWSQEPASEVVVSTHDPESGWDSSPPLPDGLAHWFHLRAIDHAGNWATETLHMGPFWIDANPPSALPALRADLPTGLPGDYGDLVVDWDAASDAVGVAGYSYVAYRTPITPLPLPDATVETSERQLSIALPEGNNHLRVAAVDPAGNVGAFFEVGPFVQVTTLPAFLAPFGGEIVTQDQSFTVRWEPFGSLGGALHLSLDGGQSFQLVSALSAAQISSGQFAWTVPATTSANAVLRLTLQGELGSTFAGSRIFEIGHATGVAPGEQPAALAQLLGNHPNPFNPQTTIRYRLQEDSQVELAIFDSGGRRVRTLVAQWQSGPQEHAVIWNGRDDHDQGVPSGVYFYRLRAGGVQASRRLLLLK